LIVRTGGLADVAAAARLHSEQIGEGFLSSLGPRFLARLYRRVVRWHRSFLLVAEEDGVVVGHAAATEDVAQLYRQFLRHDGLVAGLVAAPRLALRWRSALETLRYPSGHDDLPPAELLAVAVDSSCRGRGIGKALVTAANEELARRGVDDARVVVAAHNQPAIALYLGSGYRPAAVTEVHASTPSRVLTWS
jgi:ribosomal protein S18 acetylase RimI-like enzyme